MVPSAIVFWYNLGMQIETILWCSPNAVHKAVNFPSSLCLRTDLLMFLLGTFKCGLNSMEGKLLKIISRRWLLTKS